MKTAVAPAVSINVDLTSISALLTSIESPPSPAAVIAFKAAITRHGRNLAASEGPEALAAALARIRAEASDKAQAQDRERIVLQAWDGIVPAKERAA